jgi:DNA-binding NarL/FixJ family response regulator
MAGDEGRSVVVLRKARARAVRLGCRPLAAQATEALARLGGSAHSRSRAAHAPDLSPRQREVAHHLSAGRTNKEIATALDLSVRTVDMHVVHLFARLDCHTRTEAAAKLALLLGA